MHLLQYPFDIINILIIKSTSLPLHNSDATTVLVKQAQIVPLSTLLAIEYFEQLGSLLPADSFLSSLQSPIYQDNQVGRSSSKSHYIPIYLPITLPPDLTSFLLEFPQEIEELNFHLKQRAEFEFECWKTEGNELGIVLK